MTIAHPVSVEAQGLYKFFNPGQPTKVEYDGQTLRVFGDQRRVVRKPADRQSRPRPALAAPRLDHDPAKREKHRTVGIHGTGRQDAARSRIGRPEAPP